MSMKIKYWGVRGSLPASPTPEQWALDIRQIFNGFFKAGHRSQDHVDGYLKGLGIPQLGGFGTATTTVEVTSEKGQLIVDGGSGIRNLSEQMMKGPAGRGQANIHIFLTHFHWDHLIGLPFFTPHFISGNRITYYAVQSDLEEMVRSLFRKPNFPVSFEALAADIRFVLLDPRKPILVDDFSVTPYQLDHPDPCWGFRVQHGERVYAHCVDTEGTRVTREHMALDLPLYQNADLMYFDAQYTLPELAEKSNWGHSAAQIGLDIAFRENIKYVLFAHHDPGANTQQIYELKRQTREYFDWKIKTAQNDGVTLPLVKWRFAYEGLEIELK